MAEKGVKIFHDSWYKVAEKRVSVRKDIKVKKQFYKEQKFYLVYNPLTNKYFKITEIAYFFILRLSDKKTIEEVWKETVHLYSEHAPGQGEVIDLLSNLYSSNLLQYSDTGDSGVLFERRKKEQSSKFKQSLMNIFFIKIPLLDPDKFLNFCKPLITILFSKIGFVIWLLFLVVGLKNVIENFDTLKGGFEGALSPSNLPLMAVAGIIVKLFHEFGHGAAVKKFRGEVHTFGVMFMLLMPLPFVDTTASWAFRSKYKKMLVGASGMFIEFFIASIAILVWANSGEGAVHSMAYNVFLISSITTLLFNLNPLMKFDGYYIFSDFLEIPNLQKQSKLHIQYLFEKFALAKEDAKEIAINVNEAILFTFYGIASNIYRIVIFMGIAIKISDQYLVISVIMAIMICMTWLIMPLFKFVKWLFFNPSLKKQFSRVVAVLSIFFVAVYLLFFLMPFPNFYKAPGVVKSINHEVIVAKSTGYAKKSLFANGSFVDVSDTLVILKSKELYENLNEKKGAYFEEMSKYKVYLTLGSEQIGVSRKKLKVLKREVAKIESDIKNLILTATISGIWSAKELQDIEGRWIVKGDSLGVLLDTNGYMFDAVISQSDASYYFNNEVRSFGIRVKGGAKYIVPVDSIKVIPMQHEDLPSQALGWSGGGDIEVQSDGVGTKTREPFYRVSAFIKKDGQPVKIHHGRSGFLYFKLENLPMFYQLWNYTRKLVQKHYRI